jgi:hypothetical protein
LSIAVDCDGVRIGDPAQPTDPERASDPVRLGGGPDVDARLAQTLLYRSDLDLSSCPVGGADRVRIDDGQDHEPSRSLHLDVGFEPVMSTALFVGD